jgi:hypothetical protein
MLQAMVDDIPPIRTPSGQRRTRPGKLDADKGYDSAANRAFLRRRGITARIARRGIKSSTRLGQHRWRVARSLSWLTVDHPVPPPPIRFTGLDHEQHGDVCPANRAGSLSDERRLGRSG